MPVLDPERGRVEMGVFGGKLACCMRHIDQDNIISFLASLGCCHGVSFGAVAPPNYSSLDCRMVLVFR